MRQRRRRPSDQNLKRQLEMDVQSPLLVQAEPQSTSSSSWYSQWFPCGRGPRIPTNAETVQRLMDMKLTLAVTREAAKQDYQDKAAQVADLMHRGLKRQAYESMKTAKQHRHDWETRHAMYESVERIKSRLISQQHNVALFSSFTEANTALAKMLEEVPLDKVEDVLDEIHQRMTETQDVGEALGKVQVQDVDEEELIQFLAQDQPREEVARPARTANKTERLVME